MVPLFMSSLTRTVHIEAKPDPRVGAFVLALVGEGRDEPPPPQMQHACKAVLPEDEAIPM